MILNRWLTCTRLDQKISRFAQVFAEFCTEYSFDVISVDYCIRFSDKEQYYIQFLSLC